jgi:hypothetical protein
LYLDGLDEGLLNRAGRTIRAHQNSEKAAELYAKEPVPTMVLKSNGTNLTPERITRFIRIYGKQVSATRINRILKC